MVPVQKTGFIYGTEWILGGAGWYYCGCKCYQSNECSDPGLYSRVVGCVFRDFFYRPKIDDPVGAVSVHLTCGIWGTLAVGIFSPEHQFLTQLISVGAYRLFCFGPRTLLQY